MGSLGTHRKRERWQGQGWGDRHIEIRGQNKQKPEGTWATWKDGSLKKDAINCVYKG